MGAVLMYVQMYCHLASTGDIIALLLMISELIIGTNLTEGSTHQMLPVQSKQCN